MESEERLEDFLTKVLSASNRHELGEEVLGVLQQWKTELENTETEPEIKENSNS